LGQVIGRREATTPAPNVAERKPHKGRSPTAVFRSPSRFSGEAYTILLGAGFAFFIYFISIYNNYIPINLKLDNFIFYR
jgi:hypothetical protein